MTVGLVLTVVALAVARRRGWGLKRLAFRGPAGPGGVAAGPGRGMWWLRRLAFSGQPARGRIAAVREHPRLDVEAQATEVIGQRKLLKWTVPGAAHAATFWGFIVLLLTIIEAYGNLFSR